MQGDYEPDEVEQRTQQRPWQCDDCGLVHTHYPGFEHSLSGMAAGPVTVIRELEYNPDCHCGIHELVERYKAGVSALPKPLGEWLIALDQQLALPARVEQEIAEVVANES